MRYFLTVLIFLSLNTYGQKVADWVKLGDETFERGDYASASEYYKKAMELDSALFDLNVKYAESLRLSRNFSKAEYYYNKAFTKDRGKIFKDGQFYLASMQKANGNYKQALRNFKKFRTKVKRDQEGYLYKKCEQEIDACQFAINARLDSSEVIVKNLGEPVNSHSSEFAPIAGSDSVLYYSSMKDREKNPLLDKVKLFKASNGESKELESTINHADFHQANACFSPDGKVVYFSRCTELDQCNIWRADVDGDKWVNQEKVPNLNKTGSTTTMPMLALINGKEVLFCASDRPGSKGKMDIYWSQKDPNGYGIPVNAGPEINSPDNEISPYYLNGHLYFSSDWHIGFGGFDIFKSEGLPRDFKEPENLGFPFNTSANDIYWSYNLNTKKGYLASNRKGSYVQEGELCCNDIYSFQYPDSLDDKSPIESLEDLNKYLPVTLYFHNDEPNPDSWDTTTTLTYNQAYDSYKKLLPKYVKANTSGLSGEEYDEAKFDIEDFFAFKVDKGKQDLDLFTSLLIKELEKGTDVELSVKGFASPRAQTDYNLNLTKRRTASLVNYLTEYENGLFLPFINGSSADGGSLSFVEIPFGEYKADQDVSDVLGDEKNSIYSRGASLERKIEIQSVQAAKQDSTLHSLFAPEMTYDFGDINSDSEVSHSFSLTNESMESIEILSVKSSCGCTVAEPEKTVLEVGETTVLLVTFDPKNKQNDQMKSVMITHSGAEEPLILHIKANVN